MKGVDGRKRLACSAIIEAAVASFPSPDGADRRSRQVQRLERGLGVTAATLAQFVRFWLTITPPLPPDAQSAATPCAAGSRCSR